MDRRDFLKLAGAGSIGLSIPGSIDAVFNSTETSPKSGIVVAINRDTSRISNFSGVGKEVFFRQ